MKTPLIYANTLLQFHSMRDTFIDTYFLLRNETAKRLYDEIAKDLPIIDYHNHLDPIQIADNDPFQNISQLWINPDPYKHRAMRIHGIREEEITGNASDKTKFLNWAQTFPKTLGNPLFHWSQMELKTFFGIDDLLSPQNAHKVWKHCNKVIEEDYYSPVSLLKSFNVELLCTSDDLLADVHPHTITRQKHGIRLLPSLRGDTILQIGSNAFEDWLTQLAQQTDIEISNLMTYQEAISKKLDDFVNAQCKLADHALDSGFTFEMPTMREAEAIFAKVIKKEALTVEEQRAFQSYGLIFLGQEYAQRDWTLQLHIGAQRQTSNRLKQLAGSTGGYAAIGTSADIASIARFFNELEQLHALPRVILYTLNPTDNEAFASLTGSFTQDGVSAKIQLGPMWWYNDHYAGIRSHLITLANYSLLPHFIGMTTDSRSVLSLIRHDYFRRVLCDLLGEWVETGFLPSDWILLEETVRNICYRNSKNWMLNQKKILHATPKIDR